MSKFKHPFITENTERVDAILNVKDIQPDPDNQVLYNKEHGDYETALKNNIVLNGLKHPIVVYNDGTIKSGHTRLKIAIKLEYDTVHIQYSIVNKPKRGFKNMISLMAENQTRPSDIERQFNQIETSIEALKTLYVLRFK
jgi:disulfide oxidoreductase YuzD